MALAMGGQEGMLSRALVQCRIGLSLSPACPDRLYMESEPTFQSLFGFLSVFKQGHVV